MLSQRAMTLRLRANRAMMSTSQSASPIISRFRQSRRARPSPLFHVKQRRGWIATSRCSWNGRPRPTSSRHRRFQICGPGISPILLQLSSLAPSARRSGSTSAAAAAFPEWCWPARWQRRRAHTSTWSSATPRRRRSCARRSASRRHQAPCIWLTSGILWIESLALSIASPPARWLRYISLSASRNRWCERARKRCFSRAKM